MTHIETIPMRANDDHDRARLERAVVEAAKAWLRGQEVRGERQYIAGEVYLVRAIEALEMFENDHEED